MSALAISAFVAALVGSGHCAAMCGAFACASADVSPKAAPRMRAAATYHLARLVAYVTLGLIAGAAGAGFDSAVTVQGIVRPAALVAGAFLVIWGTRRLLAMLGMPVARAPVPRLPLAVATRAFRGAAARSATTRAALIGILAPLLPCGWLYAFVASAAATGSATTGALVMGGFWAGTVPALALVTLGLHRMIGPARRFVPVGTAVALIVVGAITVAQAIRGTAPAVHAHQAAVR